MFARRLRGGLALAMLIGSAGLAWGQPVQVQVQNKQPAPASNHSALRAKSILGASVSLQGGTGVGTVQDFVLNDDGVVEYLIVAEGGKLVTVPWEAAQFNFEKRTAVINISPEQYRQIPTYSAERYPDFATPVYRTQVYRYYGLTPGRERRLERREERRP